MISVIIATFGDGSWRKTAERAFFSTVGQPCEVIREHQFDGTLASVRNAGAHKASGDHILFLDADDELAPGYLDAMRRACRRGDGALHTPAVSFVLRGWKQLPPHFTTDIPYREGNPAVIGSVLPRSRFLEVGGFREWPLFEDWDLWARCDLPIVRVPDAVYLAHVRLDSRNRTHGFEARNYWHQKIGHDLWPDYYDAPTAAEDAKRRMAGVRKR